MQMRWILVAALVGWSGCSPLQGGINHGIGGNGKEWEKAAELFQTASDDPACGSQEASYYLMKTRLQQGLVAEAKEARNACLKLSPQSCIATQCRADGQVLGL